MPDATISVHVDSGFRSRQYTDDRTWTTSAVGEFTLYFSEPCGSRVTIRFEKIGFATASAESSDQDDLEVCLTRSGTP